MRRLLLLCGSRLGLSLRLLGSLGLRLLSSLVARGLWSCGLFGLSLLATGAPRSCHVQRGCQPKMVIIFPPLTS